MLKIHFDHKLKMWVVLRGSDRLMLTTCRQEAVDFYHAKIRNN